MQIRLEGCTRGLTQPIRMPRILDPHSFLVLIAVTCDQIPRFAPRFGNLEESPWLARQLPSPGRRSLLLGTREGRQM